jgi:hypothetical protein
MPQKEKADSQLSQPRVEAWFVYVRPYFCQVPFEITRVGFGILPRAKGLGGFLVSFLAMRVSPFDFTDKQLTDKASF